MGSSRQPATARSIAFETLRCVEERGAHADAVLGACLERYQLAPADQGLATRIVYGTLAWQGRLDWHIGRLCTTPPARLDPWLRVILRMGLFQILFLDRVPAHAAVNTSVERARRFKGGAATGLVNATLRRAAADPDALTLPAGETDPVHAQAVRWSHPPWLVTRWREELPGTEVEALLRADQEPAPTVLRTNTLETSRDALLAALNATDPARARATEYSPAGVNLTGGLSRTPAIPAASYTPQSEASQLIAYLVNPEPGDRVLDACAAPGGKTTHLAALMHDRGDIVAVDRSGPGLASVRQRAATLGISSIRTLEGDVRHLVGTERGTAFDLVAGAFDRVLVDAPCTGLGTLRGHPELRWRRGPDDVAALAALQSDILQSVAPLTAPGGILVYATCTISRCENEAVVARFLENHREFRIEDPRPELPPSTRPVIDDAGFLRTFPHRHGLDGFFAVRFRRAGPYRTSA